MKKHHLVLMLILFAIFLMRLPSLFEPFWYGDEGIFAAVARNLNFGGVLYADAWDNKPPMIYLTYQAIFKFFGVSMFSLRLVTAVFVLASAAAIYEIAQAVLGVKRALVATLAFGILTSLRVIEGNLALTEIFMILPITLAMLLAVKRKFDNVSIFVAGGLFAIASLYKQVGALETVALGLFLFFASKNFVEFFKRGLLLALGFILPYAITIAYFLPKGLVDEYIFAAYTYYRIYLGESPQYAMLINVLKFLPITAAVMYGFWKKYAKKGSSRPFDQTQGKQARTVSTFHLFLLWCAFSFLGSYFSGRTYGHYLVQAAPAVALLVASFSWRPVLKREQVVFGLLFFVPLFFLTKLLFNEFFTRAHVNQQSYYQNFADFTSGGKNLTEYNNYFDRNVNSIMALSDFFSTSGARGESAYIWGDWPWLYAISDLANPSRYVTSFHVFGVPGGKEEVVAALTSSPPEFIIKPPYSIGYFAELEKFVATNYTQVSTIENSEVFVLVK